MRKKKRDEVMKGWSQGDTNALCMDDDFFFSSS